LLTYNHVGLIESTLRSVLSQTLDGYEVLVSDDCSTDGTWDRILAIAEEDRRIRPIRTPRNLGMAANANFAVAQVTRPYVALLHHDDLYRQDLLEKWARLLERHPDVVFVFNQYGRHGHTDLYTQPIDGERIDGRLFFETYLLPRWGCPVRGTAMIRRSAWDRAGGMRERFGLLADVDLWMRLSRTGAVGYVHEPLIEIRQDRPTYYPKIYKGEHWSWDRQRILYEIHAVNRLETMDLGSPSARLRWWLFRYRLTVESLRWLGYAVVKRRGELISTSRRAETPYDLPGLRLLRRILQRTASEVGGAGGEA
jgi:glycosyltransferase involved in cell wall biosynthesis